MYFGDIVQKTSVELELSELEFRREQPNALDSVQGLTLGTTPLRFLRGQ